MKKVILPIALAAVMSLSASAQLIPNTFNYQGVAAEKSATIEVTFQIDNAQAETLYKETQSIDTNADGVFTAVVGEGVAATTSDWNAIDWTDEGLKLITLINGVNVSEAPLKAVPYANVAATFVGYDELVSDFDDVRASNMAQQSEINELRLDVNTALEFANTAGELAVNLYEQLENIDENSQMTAELIENMLERIDALENATDDIAGIQEKLRGYATVEAVADLEDELQQVKSMAENFISTFDEEYLTAIQEALEAIDVTSEVADIQEKLRGFATVEAVAELEAAQDEYDRQLQETLQESFNATYEEIEALKAGLDVVSTDLNDIVMANRETKTDIATINADIEWIKAQIQNHAEILGRLLK